MPIPKALYYSILAYQPENRALLDELFDVTELHDPRDDSAGVLEETEVLFAPLGYPVDSAKIVRCPRLRAIVSNTTGIPHIDIEVAQQQQVDVCALHDEPDFLSTITPTAEHTIGLMIAASRRLPAAHRAAAQGQWNRRQWGSPRMLSRMRLGLVGHGRIGRMVASAAQSLGMRVNFYDPAVTGGCCNLLSLAKESDVLSLHAPARPETRNLVSREILRALPREAIVINTARGELIDETALLELLRSGHLWSAALDTVDGEYDPGFADAFYDHPLASYARSHDNLILSPHIGGSTRDAWHETERFVIEKAANLLGTACSKVGLAQHQ